MRTHLLPSLPAMVSFAMLFAFAASASAADVKNFYTSWDEVKKAAQEQDKPIYLHFTTTWCGWCRKIERETYPDPQVDAALQKFVSASLDCTVPEGQQPAGVTRQNLELMERLGGSGYPYLVMTTPDLAVLNVVEGYLPPSALVAELNKAHARWTELKQFPSSKPEDVTPYDYSLQAMRLYSQVQQWPKAEAAAEQVLKLDADNRQGNKAEATLVLLQAMQKQATPERPAPAERVQELRAAVRQLDPANEAGILERALMSEAFGYVNSGMTSENPEANLRAAAAVLQELVGSAKRLERAQEVYAVQGQVLAMLGQRDAAIEALTKAKAADPNSPVAPRIDQVIEQIRAAPATQPAQP